MLGLLPALALACVLVGNWAAGRTPVEMLQVRGGQLLVDLEPNQPMRVVGELEPMFEEPSPGLMGAASPRAVIDGPINLFQL